MFKEGFKMKNFSVEDVTSIIKDIRNSEEKKSLYILLGVFVAVAAVAIGIAAIFIKKHCEECCDDDFYDDWDTEDECAEDDCCGCEEENE